MKYNIHGKQFLGMMMKGIERKATELLHLDEMDTDMDKDTHMNRGDS